MLLNTNDRQNFPFTLLSLLLQKIFFLIMSYITSDTSDNDETSKTVEEEINDINNEDEDDNYVDCDDFMDDDFINDNNNHENELAESLLTKHNNKKRKIIKSNKKVKKEKALTSFVWNHCIRTIDSNDPIFKLATCQYKFTTGKNAGEICGYIMETSGPTGNIHVHLASHGITSSSKPIIILIAKPLIQGTLDSVITITRDQKLKYSFTK